jgi:hypothetical protein
MIDSLDMSDADRRLIVESCRSAVEERIVITHGTDTMPETARALGEAALRGNTAHRPSENRCEARTAPNAARRAGLRVEGLRIPHKPIRSHRVIRARSVDTSPPRGGRSRSLSRDLRIWGHRVVVKPQSRRW